MANKKNSSKKTQNHYFPALPTYLILFVLLWLFAGFIYDDVFYICQQHTYFAFDKLLLKEVSAFWYGWAIIMGRFIMLSFHYPVFGGAIYALILTLMAYILNYILGNRKYLQLVGIVLPFVWMSFLVSLRLNIFYHYEPSFLIYLPTLVLLLLAIISLGIRFLKKRPFPSLFIDRKESATSQWVSATVTATLFIGLFYYTCSINQNTVITAQLQRQLQDSRWEDMANTARKAKHPTRPICAYYATALGYLDQLDQHLFDIFYQYPKAHLVNRNDYEDIGTFYYIADTYLYMGLANPAWHSNIDHLTMEGLSAYKLKNLCLAAMVNHEIAATEKIMYIIEQMPFECQFIKKYKPMLYDRRLLNEDPVLGRIEKMLPLKDAMEQQFFVPLFLGYYVDGNDILPRGTESISMAAALYTKQLDKFAYYLNKQQTGNTLPPNFEEALMILEKKINNSIDPNKYSAYTYSNVQQLVTDAKALPKDKKERGKLLRDKYLGMYAMYYLYENIPDENYPEPEENDAKESTNKIN